jgi:hypothetical protein
MSDLHPRALAPNHIPLSRSLRSPAVSVPTHPLSPSHPIHLAHIDIVVVIIIHHRPHNLLSKEGISSHIVFLFSPSNPQKKTKHTLSTKCLTSESQLLHVEKKGSGPRHPYAMNEVTLRAGQSIFDTSGGELGLGAPIHRMSRISLEAIRSRRDVMQEDLARKVGGGNPDDFDLHVTSQKGHLPIRKASCGAYCCRLACT